MPERLNVIGTGQATAASRDALLAALPDTSRELAHLQLLGEEVGHVDRVSWPEILAHGEDLFVVTPDGGALDGIEEDLVLDLALPGWQQTGITLPPNVVVTVTATGEGTWNGWSDATPSGSSFPYPGGGTLAAVGLGIAPFSLVMAISATNPGIQYASAIQGSDAFSFNSGAGGPLWMAFNDDNGTDAPDDHAYYDNTGQFEIHVSAPAVGAVTTTFPLAVNSATWIDSGVIVPADHKATVTITGSWVQAGAARVFPEGAYPPDDEYGANDPTHPYQPTLVQAGEGAGFPVGFACSNTRIFSVAMAARAGTAPPAFGISDGLQPDRGPTTFGAAAVAGKRLWFIVNDDSEIYGDNVGALTVSIAVAPDSSGPASTIARVVSRHRAALRIEVQAGGYLSLLQGYDGEACKRFLVPTDDRALGLSAKIEATAARLWYVGLAAEGPMDAAGLALTDGIGILGGTDLGGLVRGVVAKGGVVRTVDLDTPPAGPLAIGFKTGEQPAKVEMFVGGKRFAHTTLENPTVPLALAIGIRGAAADSARLDVLRLFCGQNAEPPGVL